MQYSSSTIESAFELFIAEFRAAGADDFAIASALTKCGGRVWATAVPKMEKSLTIAAEAARIGVRQVRLS